MDIREQITVRSRQRSEPGWLTARRAEAAERLVKFTPGPLRHGLGSSFSMREMVLPSGKPAPAATRVISEDVRFSIAPLAGEIDQPDALAAWDNFALMPDRRVAGVSAWQEAWDGEEIIVTVPGGTALSSPISLDIPVSGHSTRRILVVVGAGARARLSFRVNLDGVEGGCDRAKIPESASPKETFAVFTDLLDIQLGIGATLEVNRLECGDGACYFATRAILGVAAHLAVGQVTAGRGFRQSVTDARLEGADATVRYRDICLGGAGLRRDESCRISLVAPGTGADARSASVLAVGDKAVSGGRVTMHHGAHGAAGRHSASALLLAPGAEFCAMPDLEAESDAVRGGHAASVTGLDPERLFYLRSRGLAPSAATLALVQSFLAEPMRAFDGSGLEEELACVVESQVGECVIL
jgi:Fe-S cluster assembly scaffold protein SufB